MPGKAKKKVRPVVSSRKAAAAAAQVKRITEATGHPRHIIKAALRQAEASEQAYRQKKAESARDAYRPARADRGKIKFIGVKGQSSPAPGRQGYAVYVTTTGKKQLIYPPRAKGERRQAPTSKKLKSLDLPYTRQLRRKVETFTRERELKTGTGKPVVKAFGGTRATRNQRSLKLNKGNRTVEKLSKDIRKALSGQASQRTMLVRVEMLIRGPDGAKRRIEVSIDISRADHVFIKKEGIRNFVAQKLYAKMAKELAFAGFVTAGSSNHIRNLAQNVGLPRSQWKDKRGDRWRGNELEVVAVERMNWQIEQLK